MTKISTTPFSKVRAARELLRQRAEEVVAQYLDLVALAKEAGETEVALKALQWLIEHTPADEDGLRVIDQSADKQQLPPVKDTRPAVQIGINLGGVTKKELPGEVIDVKPVKKRNGK